MLLELDLRHLHGHSLASINTIPTSRDNGKENGNYYSIMGYIITLCWDNGKENGNNQKNSLLWPFFPAAKGHCGNHACNMSHQESGSPLGANIKSDPIARITGAAINTFRKA